MVATGEGRTQWKSSSMKHTRVLHIGPNMDDRGGISSVLCTLNSDRPLFAELGFRFSFLATTSLRDVGIVGKTLILFGCLIRLIAALVGRRVDIVHLHTAVRGSVVRKGI